MTSIKAAGGVLLLAVLLQPTPEAAAQRTRYVAFGDSVTEAAGFDDCPCIEHECRQLCGYPRRLRKLLEDAGFDAGVLNYGLGGERTPEGLTRLDEVLDEVGGHVLLLMEGTNDISREISPETTIENLSEMARKAAARGLETVHATLIPRFPAAKVDPDNVLNADLVALIRELAFEADRRLVDPFEVYTSRRNFFTELYSDSPDDPVGHPNARGYDVMAETFFNVLTGFDDVPPVLGPVEPAWGSVDVSPLAPIKVRLYDFGVGIDAGASTLVVNDLEVPVETVGGVNWQDVVFTPSEPYAPEVLAVIQARDLNLNPTERHATRFTIDPETPGPCVPEATVLCIDRLAGDHRFEVTMHWTTIQGGGQEGDATVIPLASIGLRRGGLFSFFNPDNPEVLVKVLDGCDINGHFWVFVAPTTTLGYELRVVDTTAALAGAAREDYEVVVTNEDGTEALPVSDIMAFATCDF